MYCLFIRCVYSKFNDCIFIEPTWNGWWDTPKEGTMVSIATGEKLEKDAFTKWNAGEPNGDTKENCGTIRAGGTW